MRKKITHIILLAFIGLLSAGALTDCGGETRTEKENASVAQMPPGEDSAESGREMMEMPTREEKDWLVLEESLRPAVLQIICGNYMGSGVVWEITDEKVTVVSSGHLLKNAKTCDVLCYAGIYYEAEVDGVLENCDIGFASIPADVLKEDGVELTAVVPSGRMAKELVQGEELAVYGSMSSVAGNFVKGYLIEAETEMRFGDYENEQALLLGGIIREAGEEKEKTGREDGGDTMENAESGAGDNSAGKADLGSRDTGVVDAGMSGSGVFDRQGRLLGILAGGDGERGFAAVPVWRFSDGSPQFSKES